MPRNPSARLSRSSSSLRASGAGGADDTSMDGWCAGALFLGSGISWASYAPHFVVGLRMTYAVASTSPSQWTSLAKRFDLSALHQEAKLVAAQARRIQQPLGLLHPGALAYTAEAWTHGLVGLLWDVCRTILLGSPETDPPPKRLALEVVGSLVESVASFPFYLAHTHIFAQLAAESAVLPLKYTGMWQTLGRINYADAFRYAFLPYFVTSLVVDLGYTYYSSREEEIVEWIYRNLPPFKTRNKNVRKTKRLIASSASNIAFSIAAYLLSSPLHVVSANMAIQGSGLEAALGTPRYDSGLRCALNILERGGPLAFWPAVVPVWYSEIWPHVLSTTCMALVFNALAYLRED